MRARSFPSASIIIPTRARQAVLARCLESCLAQDYPASLREIVVVDDGSVPPVTIAASSRDRPIILLRQSSQGPAAARNLGLQAANGDIVAFTDADCQPAVDWLRHLAEAHCSRPEALLGGVTRNALTRNPYSSIAQMLVDYVSRYWHERKSLQRFFTSNNFAVSRSRLLALGGFDRIFPMAAAEDRDLCDRWIHDGGELLHVPAAVVEHYHDMDLTDFLHQQFRYGRGAQVLRKRRLQRNLDLGLEGWQFYAGLFRESARSRVRRPWVGTCLLAAAQAANRAGFVYESARRRYGRNEPPID